MPIIHFHLVEGQSTPAQEEHLLKKSSAFYAEILQCPIERVRAFIQTYPSRRCAVAGALVGHDKGQAPYFEFLVLEGRPLDQRQRLLNGFTDLLVETLGVDRTFIRGHCKRVQPEEWSIGGVPASDLRKKDIQTFTKVDSSS